MKKRESAALALLIAAAAGGIYIGTQALSWNKVPVNMVDLEGDRSVLGETTITCRTELGDRGVWTTELTPADGSTKTTFAPQTSGGGNYYSGSDEEDYDDSELNFMSSDGFGVDAENVDGDLDYVEYDYGDAEVSDAAANANSIEESPDSTAYTDIVEALLGIPASILQEFAEKAADEMEYQETISLKDKCDNVAPQVSLLWRYEDTLGVGETVVLSDGTSWQQVYWEQESLVAETLAKIFSNPVTEDMELTLTKEWDPDVESGIITVNFNPDPAGSWLTVAAGSKAVILKQSYDGEGDPIARAETDNKIYVLDMEQVLEDYVSRDADNSVTEESAELAMTQMRSALTELAEVPEGFRAESLYVTEDSSTVIVVGEIDDERSALVIDMTSGEILQQLMTGIRIEGTAESTESGEAIDMDDSEDSGNPDALEIGAVTLENSTTIDDALILAYSDGSVLVLRPDDSGDWQVWLATSAEESFALQGSVDPDTAVCASDGVPLTSPSMDECRYLFDGEKLVIAGWATNYEFFDGKDWDDDETAFYDDCSVSHGVLEICVYTEKGLQYRGLAELQGRGKVYYDGDGCDLDESLQM